MRAAIVDFQQRLWQILWLDHFARAQKNGALDYVLQFAYVAWPIVRAQQCTHLGRNSLNAALAFLAVNGGKITRQQLNIFATISEWRHDHCHDVESIIKIL